jgi:hypothetical protein
LIQKYGDELTEANYNLPRTLLEQPRLQCGDQTSVSTFNSLRKGEEALSKTDRLRLQLIKQRKEQEKKKEDFIK